MNSKHSLSSSSRNDRISTSADCKVVVLGVAGVGKSSVTLMFVNGTFSSEYNPTLQDTFRKQFILDDIAGTLEILDTAGQEEYIVMQDHWIREGKGFLVVFALDMPESLEEVRIIRKRIERVKDNKDFPMIIVGNKCDLTIERKIPKETAEKICESLNTKYIETSAKKNINCAEAFMEVVKEIRKREKVVHKNEEKQSKWKEFFSKCELI